MRKAPLLLLLAVTASFTVSQDAAAQIRKPQLGIYGGGALPRGDFKVETDYGWTVGALLKVRVTRTIDARIDGNYAKLGSQSIEFSNADVESESELTFGSLLVELNLGPDSAAYPGDDSVSPYINAGPGLYQYKFEGTCAGECEGFLETGDESKIGVSVGFGANVPVRGFPLMAEARYHRFGTIFPIGQVERTATMFTVTAGFKIR
jgi:opacity protein-like surface antigen